MKVIPLSAHPDIVRTAEHYLRLAYGRAMPNRSEFYPTQFGWMLGRMYLLDVLDGGADYCIRLFGEFWQTVYGDDMAGQPLSRLEKEGKLSGLRAEYDKVVATRELSYRPGTVKWPNGRSFRYERLLLPFAGPSGAVCLILGAATCDMTTEDLVFFRGQGFPELAFDETSGKSG
jgi:hypothetical protein